MTSIVITGAKRTAIGAFMGQFTGVAATTLGATAITAAVAQSNLAPDDVSTVIMGCVLPANLGQAPARQAALGADLSTSTDCITINKVCGSGMKAVMLAYDLIKAGSANIVAAGGMESMTNAPHMIPHSRSGNRYGSFQAVDHMAWDGLTNPYDGQAMGVFAEKTAEKYGFNRQQQDDFAVASVQRAQQAQRDGAFDTEIVSVGVSTRKGEVEFMADEQPARSDISKIPSLKPAFKKEGTVTAASSSSISDGAAALILMHEDDARKRGLAPLARVVGHHTFSQEPEWFTTSPVKAVEALLKKISWEIDQVDLFEINEAFAVVPMAVIHDLSIPHEKVNVNGGACALGHPIGASGARIIVTLINALQLRGLKRGVASLCIGGGEATAMALELL